tara:strand:- start:701 stop:832 length:132 start_codon:yes stop_codon:yes gene_type:complete
MKILLQYIFQIGFLNLKQKIKNTKYKEITFTKKSSYWEKNEKR